MNIDRFLAAISGIKKNKEEKTRLFHGDCLDVLRRMPAESVDSIVTDPPYGLRFMSKKWDYDVPSVEIWSECLRVLKPGGHLLSFGGDRTHHRLMCALEDAGFEIRTSVAWLFGSGFPKSTNISKQIDRMAGAERKIVGTKVGLPGYSLAEGKGRNTMNSANDGSLNNPVKECQITAPATEDAKKWEGFGTALKPGMEIIPLCRKPLSEKTIAKNVLKHGTGALNIDGCRVETRGRPLRTMRGDEENHMSNRIVYVSLKQRRKAAGVTTQGRWPANVIHDGSEEVLEEFPESKGQQGSVSGKESSKPGLNVYGDYGRKPFEKRNDSGSAARFFYCSKASKKERNLGLEVQYEMLDNVSDCDAERIKRLLGL